MEKNKLKKESAFARFLESFGILILIVFIFAIVGSTMVILLSLFLFFIPNHKLRLNAFIGLMIVNLMCSIFLLFHPFDIVFLEDIILWANTIDPEYTGGWGEEVYSPVLDSYYIETLGGRMGLTDIFFLFLFENGVIDSSKLSFFLVTDFFCFLLYFFIPSQLAPNE